MSPFTIVSLTLTLLISVNWFYTCKLVLLIFFLFNLHCNLLVSLFTNGSPKFYQCQSYSYSLNLCKLVLCTVHLYTRTFNLFFTVNWFFCTLNQFCTLRSFLKYFCSFCAFDFLSSPSPKSGPLRPKPNHKAVPNPNSSPIGTGMTQ